MWLRYSDSCLHSPSMQQCFVDTDLKSSKLPVHFWQFLRAHMCNCKVIVSVVWLWPGRIKRKRRRLVSYKQYDEATASRQRFLWLSSGEQSVITLTLMSWCPQLQYIRRHSPFHVIVIVWLYKHFLTVFAIFLHSTSPSV